MCKEEIEHNTFADSCPPAVSVKRQDKREILLSLGADVNAKATAPTKEPTNEQQTSPPPDPQTVTPPQELVPVSQPIEEVDTEPVNDRNVVNQTTEMTMTINQDSHPPQAANSTNYTETCDNLSDVVMSLMRKKNHCPGLSSPEDVPAVRWAWWSVTCRSEASLCVVSHSERQWEMLENASGVVCGAVDTLEALDRLSSCTLTSRPITNPAVASS
ncbi:hypothetical protein C0Q70_14882 [Pomacea canaliculata]|uniref:Uncharacterized protein n=1 Tax=Pomacea canaliculata TaxID=400727 RepID=A0A2T7NT92_POMCA|nr:hypothetical protein C0Q70_14882 [Pomacea canaliculata]